jgi:hypothetical protein
VIIVLNGPFGVGKTTIAHRLPHRLPHAMIYDPEIIGHAVNALTDGVRLPVENTDDFQDIALWPILTVDISARLHHQYQRDLVVPMTLVHPGYFATITAGLARVAPPFHHFCLIATPATIHARLITRGDDVTGWAWRKSQEYLPRFTESRFRIHIDTEQQHPDAITDTLWTHITADRASVPT